MKVKQLLTQAMVRLLVTVWITLSCAIAQAGSARPPGWAVATAHPMATNAAYWVATKGGNAFDAAVAVSAALAVVEPMGSGIGGGGFWLIYRAEDGLEVMVDGRERAPLSAHKNMYLDEQGEVVAKASLDGPLAAAIPGEPAALVHMAKKYGRLGLAESLTPAVKLAAEGFPVSDRFRRLVKFRQPAFNAKARQLFLDDNQVPELGTIIKQAELAATLNEMSANGRGGFYTGWVASTLISEVTTAGGIWSQQDLTNYQIVERPPIVGHYRGARFVSASLPSSGGIVLSQMLNMLQASEAWQQDRATRTHTIVEVMRRAYRDRALYLGDSDFVKVDQSMLTSQDYAQRQIADLTERATPSAELSNMDSTRSEGEDTTHFSIIDDHGNRVAATLSINYPFGSGFVSAGTGIVLNNEMDDFVSKPGAANVYGLVGGDANSIEPGKRPLSSMSPTFVETEQTIAVVGTPGGSRIITMVLLALLELVDNGERDLDQVVNLPRFHHQYFPDHITYEPDAFDDEAATALKSKGHSLNERERPYGNMHAVLWELDRNQLSAASDQRGEGKARVW